MDVSRSHDVLIEARKSDIIAKFPGSWDFKIVIFYLWIVMIQKVTYNIQSIDHLPIASHPFNSIIQEIYTKSQ